MSLQCAAKALARADHSGSSRNRCPYSFIVLPQPAALMTMVSTLAASKVAIRRFAKSAACSSRPEWTIRAPQHPCCRGITTSKPSAARTRAVAALTCAKNASCTQPLSIPTRPRNAVPVCGRTVRGSAWNGFRGTGGSRSSMACKRRGRSFRAPPARVGERGEEHLAEEGIADGARDVALDLAARVFDQLVVLDAAGARRHAGHAAEAVVHVDAEVLVERSVALGALTHHPDAAAG